MPSPEVGGAEDQNPPFSVSHPTIFMMLQAMSFVMEHFGPSET